MTTTKRDTQLIDLIAAITTPGARIERTPGISLAEQTKRLIDDLSPKEREILDQRFGGAAKIDDIVKEPTEEERIRELEELDKEDERLRLEADEKAAARKERRRELSVVANVASVMAQQTQWIATTSAMEAMVWEKVAEAVAALPVDATHQQIALAQSRAISDAKRVIAAASADQLQNFHEEAEMAAAALADFDRQGSSTSGIFGGALGALAASLFIPTMFRQNKKAVEKEG